MPDTGSRPARSSDFLVTGMQLLRYGTNCGGVLLVKLLLIVILGRGMTPAIAYLLIHGITFFLSYLIHARHTFDVGYSWGGLRRYFGAVALFKLFDYCVFSVLLLACQVTAPASVFLASCLEAVLKFFVVRRALARSVASVPDGERMVASC
jgi:hypothetical protein